MLRPYLSVHVSPSIHCLKKRSVLLKMPHRPTVSNLSIVYFANTMQSTLMTKMYVSFITKSLLGYIKQKATDLIKWEQQFGVVLHRIDEVIEELSNNYQTLQDRIFSIQEEVESGDLDSYWLNPFELLIDLGWVA